MRWMPLIKIKHGNYLQLPKDKQVIHVKWIYKVKYHVDGSIEWHKARLVTKGFAQTPQAIYRNFCYNFWTWYNQDYIGYCYTIQVASISDKCKIYLP